MGFNFINIILYAGTFLNIFLIFEVHCNTIKHTSFQQAFKNSLDIWRLYVLFTVCINNTMANIFSFFCADVNYTICCDSLEFLT